MKIHRTVCLASLLLIHPVAHATSFDCNKGRSATEQMICHHADLSKLDDQLGKLYWQARRAVPNKKAFRADSDSKWAWREAHCTDEACLNTWYNERIDQLQQLLAGLQSGQSGQPDQPLQSAPRPLDAPAAPATRVERSELAQHARPDAAVDAKAEVKTGTKVQTQLEAEVDARRDSQVEPKLTADAKPGAKAQTQLEAEAEAIAEANAQARHKAGVDEKVEAKAPQPAHGKAAVKADARSTAKNDTKADLDTLARQCTAADPGIVLHDQCNTVLKQDARWTYAPHNGDWFCGIATVGQPPAAQEASVQEPVAESAPEATP